MRCLLFGAWIGLMLLGGASRADDLSEKTKSSNPKQKQSTAKVLRDIEYGNVGGHSLKLDLHLPIDARPAPCVVFVHGGGWKNGDKNSGAKQAAWLTEHGFAVASINYRLTDVAQWPAQIDDCYAAVRWVRQHAEDHGIDPRNVGAWGTSAGGHLASLMGTRRYSGKEDVSSRVQAVCDWFGPSELLTMPPNNVGQGRTEQDVANSNGAKLLGQTVRDVPELAKDASALNQVSEVAANFLIMHGDKDSGVPLMQSQNLHAALVKVNVPARLDVIAGAGHGGKGFQTPAVRATVLQFFQSTLMPNWSQGAGPQGSFRIRHVDPPTRWSVAKKQNVLWKTTLPETGQSGIVHWRDRVFFTTMKPARTAAELGSDVVAWCLDAETGSVIWKRKIPGKYPLRLSGCFSDSSSPPPVTDGKHVCFFNASGTIACFDLDGNARWNRQVMPVGRTQPTLVDGNVVFIKQSYMPDAGGHFSHEHKHSPRGQWTQLQAINLQSGRDAWTTSCGVNMGCIPLPMTLSNGRRVFVVGRGGGHSPPETPDGISMVDANDGTTIWTLPLEKFMSTMAFHVVADQVLVFDIGDHIWVDAMTGKVSKRVSIVDDVPVQTLTNQHRVNVAAQSEAGLVWETTRKSVDLGNKARGIIQQSNVVAGDYHYFRSYTQPWLGRVNVKSGEVEYLQLPVQVRHIENGNRELLIDAEGMAADVKQRLMQSAKRRPEVLPIQQWTFEPNDMKNSRGHVVMGDARSMGNGWGHHASAIPTVIGDYLYVPTMNGTVYVLEWNAKRLNGEALVAINDLGPVGQSWNRASLTYADGKLFAHTIREVICIGK